MKTRLSRLKKCLALFAGAILFAGAAPALDANDVMQLLQNRVGEEIILNMVRSDGTIYITPEEAANLRAMGASETLIAAMRPWETTAAPSSLATPRVTVTGPGTASASSSAPMGVVVADGSPVMPATVVGSGAFPSRFDKEGWLSISNHDWQPYFINIVPGDERIFISRHPNGGMVVNSGENVVVNLRKNTYKTYGDSGNKLEVRVREGETTTLDLNPFGVVGNSGLTGVARDRQRVRSETLFNNYAPPPTVIVQPAPPPAVIVRPAPPPVVIERRPPVIVVPGGPPHYRRYGPPPHHPPYRRW